MTTMTCTQFPMTIIASGLAAAAVACGDTGDGGPPGTLNVTVSGEQAAVEGYPVGEGTTEIGFADGWRLQFAHVVVSLADFTLRTADGNDAQLDAEPVVADLALGEPNVWEFDDVPSRRWDRVGFRYAHASAEARMANAVDDDLLDAMIEDNLSFLVEGTAEKAGRQVDFRFGFGFEVDLGHCVSGLDGTDGLVIPAGAASEAQITVHLDHLFFDSFARDDAALRFDAMAALAETGAPLTLDALAAQDNLSDLVDEDGEPLDLGYDSGSTFDPVPENLRDYVIAAATTTGHFNGEGHCDYERSDR